MSQEKIWNSLYKQNKNLWSKETKSLPSILKNKTVLEVGVGNGKTLQAIIKQKPKSITAIDISSTAIQQCKKQFKDVTFKKSSISSFKSKEKFDIIVLYYVLNNLSSSEIKKTISNLSKLLKPKGKILFEDFSIGDFRQTSKDKVIKKSSGLQHRFFTLTEIKSLFSKFSKINLKLKTSMPIKSLPSKKRKLISGVVSN